MVYRLVRRYSAELGFEIGIHALRAVFFDAIRSVSLKPVEPARGGPGVLDGMAFHEPKLSGRDFVEELGLLNSSLLSSGTACAAA